MADENKARSTKPRNDLTAEFVRTILDYDPTTGDLSWARNPGRHNGHEEKITNGVGSGGYIRFMICGHNYFAHRIIWLLMKGAWPSEQIDHVSGVRDDNRWNNLREATHTENIRNCKVRTTNTSGYKGVSWDIRNSKWRARIILNGKQKYLGNFDDIKAASAAYEKAAAEFFGAFRRHGCGKEISA